MAVAVNRFDVYLANLDPTVGSEIQKTRPCLVISPDEMNRHIRTVIVAPMTSAVKDYPTRVSCRFKKKKGQIVLDQLRTIDKARLIKKLGSVRPETQHEVISVLQRRAAHIQPIMHWLISTCGLSTPSMRAHTLFSSGNSSIPALSCKGVL